jgi:NLI interacting factor-like phosphatase
MHQPERQRHALALLIDLNGTLIYRSVSEVRDSKVAGTRVNGKWIYARPGAARFLETLSQHFTLYICTSMMMRNAMASLLVLGEHTTCRVTSVLDATFCKPDPDRHKQGGQDWDVIRDATKIWARVKPHDETTTLFVDNELRKCAEVPRSCLLVPEMSCTELVDGVDALVDVRDYLVALSIAHASSGEDVRAHVERSGLQEWLLSRLMARSASISPSRGAPTTDEERTSGRLRQVETHMGVSLDGAELTLELVEGARAVLIDTRHRLQVFVSLPLPPGERLERRVSLARLLALRVGLVLEREAAPEDKRLELPA